MMEKDTIPDMRGLFIKMLEDSTKTFDKVRGDIESSIAKHTFLPLEATDETDDSVIVKIVLPGIKKEDIETNLTETKLHVKATFDFEQAFKGIYFTLSDIKKGTIERVIRLPEKVIPEKAKASFKNGILTVEAPKLEKEEKITLEIE
ncbi:MAG: Hsp20/alpha crystallin family protein [Methanobacterium sp.]|nr:Hsp20/alpha crystallin family protein [Methanobacterium sp.]